MSRDEKITNSLLLKRFAHTSTVHTHKFRALFFRLILPILQLIYNNYIIYIYMFQEDAEKDGNDEMILMENMAADDSEEMQSVEDSVPQA